MSPTFPSDKNESLEGVSRVVLKALSHLAPAGQGAGIVRKPMETYLCEMVAATLSPEPGRLADVVKEMRRARITIPMIAETYVPQVARRLGDAWCADDVDFARMTIGCSRLQTLLRRLDVDWDSTHEKPYVSPPAFLVGVAEGGQHTLGATVLAGQLRHRGLSVYLDMDLTEDALCSQVGKENYTGVFLSVSCREQIDLIRNLVRCSHQESRSTPVIVGGTVLEHFDTIQELTQADFVTNDVYDALRYCDVHGDTPDLERGCDPVARNMTSAPTASRRSAAE